MKTVCINYEPNNCRYSQRRKRIISSLSLVCASRGAREVPFVVENNPNLSVMEIVVSMCTYTVIPKSGIEITCDPVFQRTSFLRVKKRSCCRGRPWWRTDTCSPLSRSRVTAWSDASWTRPRSKILQEGNPVHPPESCCLQKMFKIFISCFPSIILWPVTLIFFNFFSTVPRNSLELFSIFFGFPIYPKSLRMFWALCF